MGFGDNEYLTDEDRELFERVVAIYQKTESIRDTAIRTELSRSKVRKILITMGLMESEITERALELMNTGMTIKQAAAELNISTGTLSTYFPYGKRVQGRETRSGDAIRSENYRARQARAAMNQVHRIEKDMMKEDADKGSDESGIDTAQLPKVYKLHLELDTDYADMEVLKKWGKVKEGISRDILVPPAFTLHALHYAIQKCFGWENSHLHHFELPEEAVHALINHKFLDYLKYCGTYFRFPYGDDYVTMSDIYWDDDYEEGQSFKTWLKHKYNPPFTYGGSLELYSVAQQEARTFLRKNPVLRLGPSFDEYFKGNRASKQVATEAASYEDMYYYFESGIGELIERASVFEYMPSLAEELIYKYDYGDGWEVRITISDEYEATFVDDMPVGFVDKDGVKVDTKGKEGEKSLAEKLYHVMHDQIPICIEADGLPVMDDVGGVHGYCDFLNGIHGKGSDLYDDAEESREWARSMGWTGRMSKAERIL